MAPHKGVPYVDPVTRVCPAWHPMKGCPTWHPIKGCPTWHPIKGCPTGIPKGVPYDRQISITPSRQAALHGLGARRHAELAEDRREVKLHRVLADAEAASDVAIRQAVGDERQHVVLASGERFDERLLRPRRRRPRDHRFGVFDAIHDLHVRIAGQPAAKRFDVVARPAIEKHAKREGHAGSSLPPWTLADRHRYVLHRAAAHDGDRNGLAEPIAAQPDHELFRFLDGFAIERDDDVARRARRRSRRGCRLRPG